jgi:hypothetical protein
MGYASAIIEMADEMKLWSVHCNSSWSSVKCHTTFSLTRFLFISD